MTKRRPLVELATENEFGAVELKPLDTDGGLDITYVPGFSDMRFQRDRAVAEVVHGDASPKDVPSLPVNVRWVRAVTGDGQQPTSQNVMLSERKGYRLATKEDIGKPWLTQLPPGAKIRADGSIANIDTVLMVADAAQVAQNRARSRQMVETQLDTIGEPISQAGHAAGVDVTPVKKRPGRPVGGAGKSTE